MITVLTQGDVYFSDNREYLEYGLQQGNLRFQGPPIHLSNKFDFSDKKRLYDFTRSANAKVRDNMVRFLVNTLGQPGLEAPLRAAFDSLYNYWKYKHGIWFESLTMLIFVYNQREQFGAKVTFSSKAFKLGFEQYAVATALVCERFTYFQPWVDLSTQMAQLQLNW